MDLNRIRALAEDATRSVLVAAEARSGRDDEGNGKQQRSMRKATHVSPDDGDRDADDNPFNDLISMTKAETPSEMQKNVEWLQDVNDYSLMLASLLSRPHEGRIVKAEDTNYFKTRVRARIKKDAILRKQMDTATSGEGSQWVPTGYSARLFELIQSKLVGGALFEQINMPRGTWEYPITSGRPTVFLGSEQTGDETTKTYAASNPTTGKMTLTAKKLGIRIPFSEELEEDSIVPVLPTLRNNTAYHLARGLDDVIINGDTATPHQDNDVTAAADRRKAWIGLRAQAVDLGGNVSLSSFTAANLRKLISTMGEYSADDPTENLVIITGPKAMARQFRNLADATRTPEEYGGGGIVLLRGEVMRFDNIPVVQSPVFREDLNTVGVRDSTTQDNSGVIVTWKPGWKLFPLRGPRMRTWLSTLYDQQHLIADWRGTFATPWTTTEKHTVYGVDVDVS